MDGQLLFLGAGYLACLLGTLPVGPINLGVVKTTVDHSMPAGMAVAIAASCVEVLQALIALYFGMAIGDFLATNLTVQWLVAGAFMALAVFFLLRRPTPSLEAGRPRRERSFFLRGLLLAALNPQAIPFWLFALAAISQFAGLDLSAMGSIGLALFSVGVFLGKLTALYGYLRAADYIRHHLTRSCHLVNRVLASVLFAMSLGQLWRIMT